jgi:hypothetical protein
MNPETEKNINEAIDWLQSTGGSIQDFASEQAPLYCQEVVQWELWSSAAGSAFGILLIVVGIVSGLLFIKFMREDEGEPNCRTLVTCGTMFLGLIFGLLVSEDFVPQLIKALKAPRIVIVEHLRGLKP